MTDGFAGFKPFSGPTGAELRSTWRSLHADGDALWPPDARELDAAAIANILPSAQRRYGHFTADRRHAALLAALNASDPADSKTLARLRSCTSRASSAWIDTLPMSPALCLTNGDFRTALRLRLGLPLMPEVATAVTCFCGDDIGPGDIDHAMACSILSGAKHMRHRILIETWRQIASRAGVASSAEPLLHKMGAAATPTSAERGDILLALPDALAIGDVSVIHPAAASYSAAAARSEGAASRIRDAEKRRKYAQAEPAGYPFIPLTSETFGRLGAPAMQLLNDLAARASASGTVQKDSFVKSALRDLSITLCKGNGENCRRCTSVLARVSGTTFMAGASVPHADAD